MPLEDSVVISQPQPITVAVEPAHAAIHSLMLLAKAEHVSGFGEWVTQTVDALTPDEKVLHTLVLFGMHYAVVPQRSWPTFPAYVDHLAAVNPIVLRDKLLNAYASFPVRLSDDQPYQVLPVDWAETLKDVGSYLNFLRTRFSEANLDEEIEARAYNYVIDPPAMQERIVSHLRTMWERYLAPEWLRVEPLLQQTVSAFQQIDFRDMSRQKAAEFITGQSLIEEKWHTWMQEVDRVVFVPSAHVGPYMGKLGSLNTMWVFFGARVPEGVQVHAPDLSRTEILTRLNAIADDTRLRILKLVIEQGELSSQEIIAHVDLSQSVVSRHLKQLSAAGYLNERRCNGAKCYTLNPNRVKQTLRAVSTFLLEE